MTLDPDGCRYLCSAMLNRAIIDMRTRGETTGSTWVVKENFRSYVSSVVWLGSSSASVYFDILDIKQEDILYATKWSDHAREVLNTEESFILLSDNDIGLLCKGIDFLRRERKR